LGIAEAGFFPGMVLYLTYWIPAGERARTGALFMMAAPVAVIVGAPVSEAILKLNGWLGLAGWQWLFILEGLPAVALGVLALRVLTDTPEKADWLTPKERDALIAIMRQDQAERGGSCSRLNGARACGPTLLARHVRLLPEHRRHVRHLPVAA